MAKPLKRLMAFALASALLFSLSGFSTAEAGTIAAVTYKNKLNNRCLANWVRGGFAGTGVCGTDPWTGWNLLKHGGIYPSRYLLQNTRTGGCLQRRSDGMVISADCNQAVATQVWTISRDGGLYMILGDGSPLEVSGPTGVKMGGCVPNDGRCHWI